MNLLRTVVKMVWERGSATADDLAPLLPQYTREQVRNALRNASRDGSITCTPGKMLGAHGRAPAVYTGKAPEPTALRGAGISDALAIWIEERAVFGENGCLIWKLSLWNRRPVGRFNGKTTQVRREIWEQQHGKKMPQNWYAICKHGCDECVEPSHVIAVKRSAVQRQTSRALSTAHRQAIRDGRWSGRTKLDPQKVEQIRASGKTHLALAQEFGVSERLIGMVRRGEIWRDYVNPFAGLFTGLASNDSARRAA